MAKRILVLALALLLALSTAAALAETVKINAANFPDASFRKALEKVCDKNKDGKLSDKEIKAVKRLDLSYDHMAFDLGISGAIKSLKGIERFKNLQALDFSYQDVKTLNVSKNTNLKSLSGDWNQKLSSVKLGKNKKLNSVWLSRCDKLKKLDIGGCPELIALLNRYDGEGNFGLIKGGPTLSTTAKLYNGKKLLTRTKKPTSIAFKKKSVTVTKKQLNQYSPYDLGIYLTFKPAGTMYPIRYSSSNKDFVEVYKDEGSNSDSFWINPEAEIGSTATLTAKCGGKTAKIKITLKK